MKHSIFPPKSSALNYKHKSFFLKSIKLHCLMKSWKNQKEISMAEESSKYLCVFIYSILNGFLVIFMFEDYK